MRSPFLFGWLWACWASIAFAQAPNLAALTPAGAGFYVELREPAKQARLFLEGNLGRRVRAFGPVAKWREQQLPGVMLVAREVARRLGVSLEELRDDVLAGGVAASLWPHEGPRSEEQNVVHLLLVVSAKTPAAIEKTVGGLDRAQQASGELLKVEQREHAGLAYKARTIKRSGKTVVEFLAALGPNAAYSDDEPLMKRFLELQSRPNENDLLGDAVIGRRLKQASPDAAAVAVFDPRPWKGLAAQALAVAIDEEDDREIADLKNLAALLESVDGAVASLDLRDGLVFDARVDLLADKLPPEAATVLAALSGPVDWPWAPSGALVVLAGRADVAALLRLAVAAADEHDLDDWKKLQSVAYGVLGGLNLVEDVLGRLGPSGAIYLAPRDDATTGEFPLDLAAAVEWRAPGPGQSDARPAPSVAVEQAFRSLLHVTAAVQNSKTPDDPAVVRSERVGDVSLTVLEDWNELPRGLAIAYASQPTLFVVGTSVGAAAGAARGSPSDALAARIAPRLASSLDARPPSHVAYVNLAAARAFLSERRPALASWIAAEKNAPEERVERSLAQLAAVLELADSAALVHRVSTDCVSLTLRVVVESPGATAP